jgi:hypothetical protein
MSLFLRNSGARVRCDQPLQKSSADAFPVTVSWLAGVQFDPAQMFGALVAILLGAEQANRGSMVTIQRSSAEPIGQQHVIVERVVEHQGDAEAIGPFEE